MADLDQLLGQIVSENEDSLGTGYGEAMEDDVRAGRKVERDQEINLYMKVIKTLAFRVKKSETVKNLKAMLHEHEGIPEVLQQLFFDGHQLGDECKIIDCGIADNSTLHAFVYNSATINLHIKIPSKQITLAVNAKFGDSIQCVKSMIQAKEGIQPNNYSLHHDGKILEDSMSLASLNFQGEPTLHLVSNPNDVLPIYVKTPYGKLLKLQVKLLYTIGDVKNLIESNMPVGSWDLVHEEAWLEGQRTLAYYELKENAILEMQRAAYQIFVKIWTGKSISLEVNHLTTISDVKHMVFLRTGMPADHVWLGFAGKVLKDHKHLVSYSILKDSTIDAHCRKTIRTGNMLIAISYKS